MPPSLLKNDLYLSLAFIHGGTTQLLDTVLKVTTWSSGAKNFQMGLPSIWACYKISLIFIKNILIFSHPPSFELSIIL